MSSKSLSHAKTLLVLCLLTASASAYYAKEWRAASTALTPQLSNAKADLRKSKESLAAVKALDADSAGPYELNKVLASTVLAAFNNQGKYGVVLNQTSPDKQGTGGSATVSAISDSVPGSSLKSIKLKLTGTYSTYPDLVGYLESLQQSPAAITQINVKDQSFEISLRAYGANSL